MLETALSLVKDHVGFRSAVRDTFITAIINGVMTELSDVQGLVLVDTNPHHLMFVVDLSAWRYKNRDSQDGIPRHLQFRLHNMMINKGSSL